MAYPPSGLGSSFSPQDPQKKTALAGTPIQQALQILSLHLPRILGAGAPAPRELLAAGGQFRPAPNVTGLVGPPAAVGAPPPSFQGPPVQVGGPPGMAGTPGFQFGQPPGQMPGPPQYAPGQAPHPMMPPPAPSPVPFDQAEFQRRMQEWQNRQSTQGRQGMGGAPPPGPPMRGY